jgi:heme-degrading monooxygenase HmoA
MTITEIALLHLWPGVTIEDTDLRSKLAHAKIVMQDYTGRTFYYLQQVEDPALIYIFGEWDSLDQHMNKFIPGAENQELLKSLKDLLSVDWLLHIDVPHADLPLPTPGTDKRKAAFYGIGRHFVKNGQRDQFQQTFDAEKHHLQEFVTEGTIGGGWRIDKEDNKEEFALLTPWTSVEQHYAFAETDGFKEYGRIREHIEGVEIKHARMLDI